MTYFAMIGVMTCIYAVARLLNYCGCLLEDKNKSAPAQTILALFTCILYLLSAPVAIVLGLIELQFIKRLTTKHDREITSIKAKHISLLAQLRK